MKNISQIFIICNVCLTLSFPVLGQEETKLFRDSTDGAFDISRWLLDLHGFVPIVSIITEPALGYGGVLAGVFFIPKEKSSPREFKMPDIVGVAGGYTENGTWFTGGGYAGFWKDDRIRYRGILGYGSINIKYYGTGEGFLAKHPVKINIESLFFLQQAAFRLKASPFLLGGNYYFGKTRVTAFEGNEIPGISPVEFELINSGLGFISEYETFNNILSPSKGLRINLSYSQSLELLGSDRNFGNLTFFALGYLPIKRRWNSGFRLESILASDNAPFYLLPYINLRGIPVLRYQGEMTVLAETEQFVNVYKRWSMVGFVGIGSTVPELTEMNFTSPVWNVGAGFRYLIARQLGLQMGCDVALGPENWALYIVFGSAWLR